MDENRADSRVVHYRTKAGEIVRCVLRVCRGPLMPHASQHVVHGDRVSVVRMRDRADQGVTMRQPGEARHVFANLSAWDAGHNRSEFTAHL